MTRSVEVVPSEIRIFQANRNREKGRYAQAAKDVEAVKIFSFEKNPFTDLSLDEKKRLLMASRIYVNAKMNIARKTNDGREAASNFRQVKRVIEHIYRNPQVEQEVGNITSDTRETPYEFRTEMARDEIGFLLDVAALTGNTVLFDRTIVRMDEIIAQAVEPSARTLLIFDKARVLHMQQPTEDTFADLTEAFRGAVRTSSDRKVKNWERVATVAARYTIEARKMGEGYEPDLIEGQDTFAGAEAMDESMSDILARETVKDAERLPKIKRWRRTLSPGRDYAAELAL